jgi:MFS family permease
LEAAKKNKISTFRAFRNRNYALYFSGQSISQIGTWMQRTAVYWVIFTITHSSFMLGVAIFATQFPSFLFSLYGGIVSDRYNRYKTLLITQTASMVQAVLMTILILTNHNIVWEILSLSVVLGIINAFDVPVRQPLVHELIDDKADLPNALALNSSMNNIARLIGPALSGLVLVKFGAGICFLLNAVSFVAVITSLLLMKLQPYAPSPVKNKISADLKDGFIYLKNTPAINMVIIMLIAVSLLVLPYNTLLPVFAKVIFKGNAATFGYINSFIGLGAVSGTMFLASLKPGSDLKIVLLINAVILGIGLMFFSHINTFALAMGFAVVCGFSTMCQTTICITLVQVNSSQNMRGRVMSFVAMGYFGMLPIGSLLVGAVSQKIGAQNTLFYQGIISIIIACIFFKYLSAERFGKNKTVELIETEQELESLT